MSYEKREISTRTGKLRIEVRYWRGSGEQRVELRRRFKTMREANLFIDQNLNAEIAAQGRHKLNGPDPMQTLTFAEEFNYWCESRQHKWSPGRLGAVKQFFNHLGEVLGCTRIAEIRPNFVRQLEGALERRGDGCETIRHKIGMIKAVLNHSVEMERIPYNPIARYRLPKRNEPDVEFWEADEARAFLDFAQAKYTPNSVEYGRFVIYMTALNTGVRAGELWAMRAQSLRKSLSVIQLTEQYHAISKGFRTLKGKQGRQVPMSSHLQTILNAWIKERGIQSSQLLFANHSGNPMDHNNFYDRVFLKDIAEWGGRKIKFHGLRHTAATLMLDQGVNIRTLQRILGHKDLETTERYVHTLGRKIQEAAETFSLLPTILPSQPIPPEASHKRRHLSVVS